MNDRTNQPIMKIGVDMRLTGTDVGRLTSDQARALFEGIGRISALLITGPSAERKRA